MAFLAKGKKEDLRVLAEELGEQVGEQFRIIELKDIILGSEKYEEAFVKEMYATIVSNRKEKEEAEKLEKDRLLEAEKLEKERLFEAEKLEKERLFEAEKLEKDRWLELEKKRLELEQNRLEVESRISTSENGNVRRTETNVKLEFQKLVPRFDPKVDDISLFLQLFERQAKILKVPSEQWVTHLIGILPSEMSQLIARESEDLDGNYDYVKNLLLKRFKLSPEKFRQLFVKLQKLPDKTWHDFYYELKVYFEGWISGLEIKSFEQLKDLMLTDQIKKRAPLEFREHFIDQWTTVTCPVTLAEKIEEFEDVKKCTKVKSNAFAFRENKKFSYPKRIEEQAFNTKRENNKSFSREKSNEQKDKNREYNFDKRKSRYCYECLAPDHIRPQCPKLKGKIPENVNRVREHSENKFLTPYIFAGKVNGTEIKVLRDTGATVDVVSQKYVTADHMTGETVWVQNFMDDNSVCLPIAEVEIECELGHVFTKAAVIARNLDQNRYLLGNQTAALMAEKRNHKGNDVTCHSINMVTTRSQVRKKLMEENNSPEQGKEQENEVEEISEEDLSLLPPAEEANDSVLELIKINAIEFLEAQRNSKELVPLFKLAEQETTESKDFRLLNNKMLVKRTVDKMGIERNLLVVPENLRVKIKTLCHEGTSGHLGVAKTKDRLLKHFFWPKCYKDIELHIKTCDPCQRAGKANDKKKSPLTLVPIISEIFSRINVDACGPLPISSQGNRYLITAMCLSSRYPDAIPVKDIASKSVIGALQQIFSRMGFPREIQTDQGSSFMSVLTTEYFKRFGIKVIRSSVYHPQTNPVERFHRTIKRILRVLCYEDAPDWEKQIPAALFALRTVRHESTGFSPSELVHGKNLRTPVTLLYEKWTESEDEGSPVVEYVFNLINRMKRCQDLAIEKMTEAKIKQKVWYDRHAVKREFQEGDLVLVLNTSRPNKLALQWKGPGKIEKKLSATNYVISFSDKNETNQVYHANLMKPYYKRMESVNVMNCLEESESSDFVENFPMVETDPNVFDFKKIVEDSSLRTRVTANQIDELHKVLARYVEIFSNIPGKTNLVQHDIELTTDTTVRSKPYRMSPRQRDILKNEINKMLQYKIIEEGESEYTSPMILVEVPGRDPRPCIDYRRLNEIVRTEFYPIPNIEERVETVAAANYITVLDLSKGYWQIPLTPKAQRIAAFVTSFGTYRPLRMPFGLKNAPFYFSKMMSQLLQNCEHFAVPYLDDIAVYSSTWEEHLKHLEEVLSRIRNARLTIKPNKCKFAHDEVKYLGHVVGKGKRSPSALKVKAIQEFPTPKTKTEIRAFLGLAGYYRQYIPMFSAIASPLTETLKGKIKKEQIIWTDDCENAFKNLKEKLSNKPVLYAPNFDKTFILQTDACDAGIGIVLAQLDDQGNEHPVIYISKKFQSPERRYSTTEKECAAIVYAVKKLKCYLDGQSNFLIQTDHNPLVWLKKNAGANPRLLRWALALQPFNYKIEHKKGKSHTNVDSLSRNPCSGY